MYRSLLQQGWHSDNPPYLPNDDATLRLMADAPSPAAWAKNRSEILSRFQKTADGNWLFHPKSLREYERAVAEHERKAFGGVQRWKGEHQQSTSSAPTQPLQTDTAPLSSHNHNYNHNQSTSTTEPVATKVSGDNNELASTGEGEGPGANSTNGLIEDICNMHPRLQKPVLTQQYVVIALQEEIARGKTLPEALDYLRGCARLYREMTDQWPEDQHRYIMSSHEFFRSGEYRTDPKFWKKTINSSEQHQSLPTAAIPAPASERIKKQLEAERQTAQTGNGGPK